MSGINIGKLGTPAKQPSWSSCREFSLPYYQWSKHQTTIYFLRFAVPSHQINRIYSNSTQKIGAYFRSSMRFCAFFFFGCPVSTLIFLGIARNHQQIQVDPSSPALPLNLPKLDCSWAFSTRPRTRRSKLLGTSKISAPPGRRLQFQEPHIFSVEIACEQHLELASSTYKPFLTHRIHVWYIC